MELQILPLVPNAVVPTSASATTRSRVPPGYGVQEQCLPFTAASALGLLIRSPIAFGLCRPEEVPASAHSFVSPLESPAPARPDPRVFYAIDDPACGFSGNAFAFTALPNLDPRAAVPIAPGLSFFDRPDQLGLFKLHLPFICRSAEGIDALFLSPLNRVPPFDVLSGLVETDWYAHPVNLILRKPSHPGAVHVAKGDPVAQLIFIDRARRKCEVTILPGHARLARELSVKLDQWQRQHSADRSAYKHLVRTQHGRVEPIPRSSHDGST
ncbi:MAG: DUF6065 family protein [Pseudomonadota bacterium]